MRNSNRKQTDELSFMGSYVIKTWCAKTGKLLSESKPIKNRIVLGTGYGRDIVTRQLAGDTTYPIAINSAAIGTGTSTPADADTGLGAPVLSGIAVASTSIGVGTIILSFFITDAQLPAGTYTEFGIFCTLRLFARSLITPVFTKSAGQNVTVDYTITLNSA